MKCPGCGEINDAGMAFCIFCGLGLAVAPTPAPPPGSGLPPSDEQMRMSAGSTSQMMVLICTVCNKSDPLNGQYCVFCGGRTVASPLNYQNPSHSVPNYNSSPYNSGSSFPALPAQPAHSDSLRSEEFVRSMPPQMAQNNVGTGIVAIVICAILGAGAAVGAIYYMKEDVQKASLNSSWPEDGVLILTKAPNAELRIDDNKRKSLIFGRLSAQGSLHLPSIADGAYMLTISDANGKQYKGEFNVNPGSSNVIGYPKRIELK